MSTVIEDKQAWSRAKQVFRALSAPGMEWADLTEDQRLYWRNRAADVCGPETVEMMLWQVTVVFFGGKQITFYLDAGVQGIPTERAALQWVADSMPTHRRVSVMAIHHDIQPPIDPSINPG